MAKYPFVRATVFIISARWLEYSEFPLAPDPPDGAPEVWEHPADDGFRELVRAARNRAAEVISHC